MADTPILSSSFVLVQGHEESRNLLKEEMKLRFPGATFALSFGEITSFKARGGSFSERSYPEPYLSMRTGLFLEKKKPGEPAPEIQLPKGFSFWAIDKGNEVWWAATRDPEPAALPTEAQLERVPSRSYFKLKEMCERSKLLIQKNEQVVEVGCAPGGMTQYALEQGARVVGIDRAEMDPRVFKNLNFTHIRSSIKDAPDTELPETFDWLVMDLHAEPWVAFRECAFLFKRAERGVFFTMKINDVQVLKTLSQLLVDLKKVVRFKSTWIGQVPSNAREVSFVATLSSR